jgi:Domain of unknown function (DUF6429)
MMEIDTERVDAAVLTLLLLSLHDGCRVWKGFDWDAMQWLHKKGFISVPVERRSRSSCPRRDSARLSSSLPRCSPPRRLAGAC